MRPALIVVGLLGLVAQSNAACPNLCSGHGACQADDVCACYPNWMEGDCSKRKCPYGKAWSDIKDTDVTNRAEHYYAECSNRGVCDREVGQCQCDEGFEGEACGRMSCPGNCNGHGTCELMESVNSGYAAWDAKKIQHCKCDPGYEGHDCSSRKCKLGNDPLTLYTASTVLEDDEVQEFQVTVSGGTLDAGSTFILKYTDWRGATWVTRPIPGGAELTEVALKEALTTLPQRAIDDVGITIVAKTSTDTHFKITFTSEQTPGDQPDITMEIAGCTVDGCQPYYSGMTSSAGTVSDVGFTEDTKGTAERMVCSNRGVCNGETGNCRCFNGFYGQACEKQTLVL